MNGEGIEEMIASAKNTLFRKANTLKKKVTRTVDTVLNGPTNFPRPSRDVLRTYGNTPITKMEIGRTPVQSAITTALNVVSFGKFKQNNPYDKLFHLFLKLYLDDGKIISLEKNEVITIALFKDRGQTEYQSVPISRPLTLNELVTKAKERMGGRFFLYDSANNNCQDFVLNVLQASNLGTDQDYAFIKQDTEQLFKGLSKTKGVARFVTDLGAKVNALVNGAGLSENYVVQSVVFPKSFGLEKAAKWLQENKYKVKKVDEKKNTLRFRQLTPATVKKNGYTEFRNKEIGDGIILVLAYKKIATQSTNKMPKMQKGSSEAKAWAEKMCAARGKAPLSTSKPKKAKEAAMYEAEKADVQGSGLYAGRGMGEGLFAGRSVEGEPVQQRGGGLYAGRSVIIHHHHHYAEGSGFWDNVGSFAKDVGKQAIKKALPIAGKTLGTLAGAKLGGPAGAMLGADYGGKAGEAAADAATSGWGLKRKGRFEKGSQAARDHMAKIRAMRKKK